MARRGSQGMDAEPGSRRLITAAGFDRCHTNASASTSHKEGMVQPKSRARPEHALSSAGTGQLHVPRMSVGGGAVLYCTVLYCTVLHEDCEITFNNALSTARRQYTMSRIEASPWRCDRAFAFGLPARATHSISTVTVSHRLGLRWDGGHADEQGVAVARPSSASATDGLRFRTPDGSRERTRLLHSSTKCFVCAGVRNTALAFV